MTSVPEPTALSAEEFLERAVDRDILDCRDMEAFSAGHLPRSGHVPFDELTARRHELPPRDAEFVVVADSATTARAAANTISGLGYTNAQFLNAALADLAHDTSDRSPARSLWRASPFLTSRLGEVPVGKALDVAAGAGREAVRMALQGFDVEALDRAPEALERASDLASRSGVRIRTHVIDLEKRDVRLPERNVQLVTVFRFLHRALLPWLESCVAPGGHLIYETFRLGQEAFGRPSHPRFLFWPGELEKAFPALETVHYEETEPVGGPIMARLHARRPLP